MRYFILVLFVITILTQVGEILAYDVPEFTSCLNPQGSVKANYETGTHGIVGKSGTFEGKDTVYSVSENSLTQCFCAVNGSGIQTNWWKAATLSESEIAVLKSQGWVYIPNGALWGLEGEPYLALNSEFTCKSSGGNSVSGSSNNSGSSSSSSGNNSGTGSVLAAASGGVGQVLGLASTGNSTFLFLVSLISALSLISGLILKRRANKFSK